jgi:Raf kinase inhibitor-like YbhB/YbcL family protein
MFLLYTAFDYYALRGYNSGDMKKILAVLLIAFFASGIAAYAQKAGKKMIVQKISIKSPAFKNMGYLPVKYSRDGKGINPPLVFANVPARSKSLVLIMDDPDAPYEPFDHWVIFNIPPKTKEIKEGKAPLGAVMGSNSAGTTKYTGPLPPIESTHHYEFSLYALDTMLSLKEGSNKFQIEQAMAGHVIGQGILTVLYKR